MSECNTLKYEPCASNRGYQRVSMHLRVRQTYTSPVLYIGKQWAHNMIPCKITCLGPGAAEAEIQKERLLRICAQGPYRCLSLGTRACRHAIHHCPH